MGFLDTVVTPGSKSTTIPKSGGKGTFLSAVKLPNAAQSEIALLERDAYQSDKVADEASSLTGMFKNTVAGIWDTAKSFGSGLISAYTDPSVYTRDLEEQSPAILRPITTPVIRTFAPLTEQLNKDIVASIVFNNPKLYDKFTQGLINVGDDELTPAQLDARQGIIAATQKTPVQIVGDVAQAVLGAYAPVPLTGKLGSGFAANAARNAEVGFTFGVSQAASSGSKDPKEIANIVLQNTIGGAILGIATEGVARGFFKTVLEGIQKIQERNAEIGTPDIPEIFLPEETARGRRQTHEEYARSQGYEPYLLDDELPNIDFGPKPKDTLPVIEAGAPKPRKVPGDVTFEPIPLQPLAVKARAAASAKEFVATAVKEAKPEVVEAVRTRTNTKKDAPAEDALQRFYESTNRFTDDEKTISGLAESVKAETIKEGIDAGIGRLPEYGAMNMAKQAEMARSLIEKDPKYAMQVARGEIPSPNGQLLAESVYTAFRVLARETPDVKLKTDIYRQLAEHSPMTESSRAAGQRIKALDSGLRDDALDIIQDIKETRKNAIESKSKGAILKEKKKIAEDIKGELKKTKITRQTWEEFIGEIQCKY